MKNCNKIPYRNGGFVLVYTVLILSIMLIVGGIFVESILKEASISKDEVDSLKAYYAAETGVECVRFLHNRFDAFSPTTPEASYNCGIGASFLAGGNPANRSAPAAQCVADSRAFTLDGFENGSCTTVTVVVTPRTIVIGGVPTVICDIGIISDGKNTCSGSYVVGRTRWEDI